MVIGTREWRLVVGVGIGSDRTPEEIFPLRKKYFDSRFLGNNRPCSTSEGINRSDYLRTQSICIHVNKDVKQGAELATPLVEGFSYNPPPSDKPNSEACTSNDFLNFFPVNRYHGYCIKPQHRKICVKCSGVRRCYHAVIQTKWATQV